MRQIDSIIVHCSATYPEMEIGVNDIKEWHLAKGWSDVGYHFVITRAGEVQTGRPLEREGAHAKGYNDAIGICLVGGLAHEGKQAFNFRRVQLNSLDHLITQMRNRFEIPVGNIFGHNEVSPKDCPCFDVRAWLA